jgi:hypothetical protein
MNEYFEKKIKIELSEKEFQHWNKESILFLVSIFEYDKLKSLYDFNLILLNDYIKWFKKIEKDDKNVDMYDSELLTRLYLLIKEDLNNHKNSSYQDFLNGIVKEDKAEEYKSSKDESSTDGTSTDESSTYESCMGTCPIYSYHNFLVGFIITIVFILFKYFLSFIFFDKKEEKKHIFELKLPIPTNLINNSLIKYFLGDKLHDCI